MAALPLIVTVTSSPADLVSRVTVSAGYELQGQKKSAGTAGFDHRGGMMSGSIESDALGGFPTEATVIVTVDYTPESGLTGFTKTFPVPLTPAGGHLFYDVPKQLDRQMLIAVGFELNKDERVQVRWDHLVNGSPVKGEPTEVRGVLGPGGSHPTPNQVLVRLKAHPEQANLLQVRVVGVTPVVNKPLDPFTQTFPVESQAVVLRTEEVTASGHRRVVAEAF